MDPFRTIEEWVDRDTFRVRRKVIAVTTERKRKTNRVVAYKVLKDLKFEGAHNWPLQWGGREVTEGIFWAHKEVNASIQKRLENAVARLAKSTNGTGIEIYVTVDVERYLQRNLLKRATYRIEAVSTVGAGDAALLGEITIHQKLTSAQRMALVEGQLIGINEKTIVAVEGELLTTKVDDLVEGLRRSGDGGGRGRLGGRGLGGRGTGAAARGTEVSTTAVGATGQIDEAAGRIGREALEAGLTGQAKGRVARRLAGRAVRVLGRTLIRLIPVLGIIDTAFLVLDIVSLIDAHYRNKAINRAVKKALKKDIPDALQEAIKTHGDEISE